MSDSSLTVLGNTGFIGSHLLRYLVRQGFDCFVPKRGDERIYTESLGHVFYCIGLTADFRTRPLETVEAHVCLLRQIISEADFESLTYLSSTRVYAGSGDTRECALLRINPCEAGDLYNLSKLMGESLCLHSGRPGMKVARLSNIVGLRSDSDTFIDQLLKDGYKSGRIKLRSSLDSKKDYLAVDDAVFLLTRIALSDLSGIFNVASGKGIENAEIVGLLESELGFRIDVIPDAPVWSFNNIDVTRIRTELGFSPREFSTYFTEYLNLYRQRKEQDDLSRNHA